jgi:hypothetical protein
MAARSATRYGRLAAHARNFPAMAGDNGAYRVGFHLGLDAPLELARRNSPDHQAAKASEDRQQQ